jgi:hypothetical protein
MVSGAQAACGRGQQYEFADIAKGLLRKFSIKIQSNDENQSIN